MGGNDKNTMKKKDFEAESDVENISGRSQVVPGASLGTCKTFLGTIFPNVFSLFRRLEILNF